jgi:hypothetical protein
VVDKVELEEAPLPKFFSFALSISFHHSFPYSYNVEDE